MNRTIAASLALLLLALPSSVAAQEPSASPPAGQAPAAASAGDDAPATSSLVAPAWALLELEDGPAAREDHTWTVDHEGRFAYLFGGRDGSTELSDLWRFDLHEDAWERLAPKGRAPSARFGHSAVWLPGLGLVVFAGQQGADFFGDLWVYDPARDAWKELPANGAAPKPRYGSCMILGPDGRLWISHGFTFAGRFDDTRAYNLKTRRWASIAPSGRRPGERCLHECFTSVTGELVLYGGQDNAVAALGDIWLTRDDGTWRRLPDPALRARRLYAVAEMGPDAWILGGAGRDGEPLYDLWRVDRETLVFQRVATPGRGPAARSAGTLISDPVRGRLLLFGGRGKDARADLWQLADSDADARTATADEPTASPSPAATDGAAPTTDADSDAAAGN